jgi:hypothetical protein
MWNEPYLETCCRSALHRLTLVGPHGRPEGLKDGPCLLRLTGMALARQRADGRFEITDAGRARHASEILKAAGAFSSQVESLGDQENATKQSLK